MHIEITKDTIVERPEWSEPVQILVYDPLPDGGAYVAGKLIDSQKVFEEEITASEAAELRIVSAQIDFTGNSRQAFLALEAKRYRYAALYDPTLAISISKVDPLPHQIEAVSQVIKQTRIRFLIADDPGAGKTIMAGLILKELKLRNQAKRILIVAPGHLVTQWIEEMKVRFEENFTHITRAYVNALQQDNVWNREQQLITSMDFARQDEIRNPIANAHFDLVIVDEAHKMAAYRYGDKTEKTKRYQLGECLSQCSTHLLFLTATPHRGDTENFQLFLDLLEPGFFTDTKQIQESIAKKDNPLFIRRIKEDLKDFDGKPLFLPRHVKTKPFRLGVESEIEMELYNDLSEYIREQYNRFSEDTQKRNNVAFALVILQRRLASSTSALFVSLQRRQQRLKELMQMADLIIDKIPSEQIFEDVEDLSEENRIQIEEQWEVLSVAENRDELRDEIETLSSLELQAQQIIDSEQEIKVKALRDALNQLNTEHPNEKILIFTEYFDTLDYLKKKVTDWGYSVSVIHGKLPHEDRIDAQEEFKNKTQLLIATEAAGEGINLQFCHLMINYDLPWNPNRLEQRMGRIHRYGQKKEVYVINLVASDTREGAVFTRLFEKLEIIRDELGTDRVYDVIGELFPQRNLAQLMLEAAASTRDHAQLLEEIETTLNSEQLQDYKRFNQETLVSPYINIPQVNELQQHAREHGLIPEYTREFFRKSFKEHGITIGQRKDRFYRIERIPTQLIRISQETQFQEIYPKLNNKNYTKVTFDKTQALVDPSAEFISFGHPLFEATIQYAEKHYSNVLKTGACFEDPDGKFNGVVAFYEGEIMDGSKTVAGRRLFAYYLPENSEKVEIVNPKLLWDFKEAQQDSTNDVSNMQELEEKVVTHFRKHLEQYKQELAEERQRQVDIKRRYGITSLDQLIIKMDSDLLNLSIRREKGEDVRIVIQNKEELKRQYEEAREKLEGKCKNEVTLARKPPIFVGAIRVKPATNSDESDVSQVDKLKVERIGMECATQYEEAQGCNVTDVSAENLGFDLRSITPDGKVRCIEVKARSSQAPVVLTSNEWFMAKQLQDDYYIYVVLNATTQPKLHIIQNPAENITAIEQVADVRYQVPLSEITQNAIPIDN